MKRAWKFAYTAAAIAVVAFGIVAPGCSSDDDSSAAPDNDASTGSPDAVTCVLEGAFSGGPCFPVGPALCFQECTSGGCVCTRDTMHPGADAGVWVCQSDTSCLPDAPPVDFDAPDFVPDANVGPDDAGADANADDASDAGADADAE
jgi:hypothetical protein